jgi:hypothetical protein
LTHTYNGQRSLLVIPLSGTATAPGALLSKNAVTFGMQATAPPAFRNR